MPYVRSFDDARPPPRYDGMSFTEARIQEAPAAIGPWTTLVTIALAVDADPGNPILRDFTVTNATLETGWYRIVWRDAAGATFEGAPVQYLAGTAAASGAPYFTIAEARALPPLSDTATYTGERIDQARRLAEQVIEEAADVAFTPRTQTFTLSGDGTRSVRLPVTRPRAVIAATINGAAVTSGTLAGYVLVGSCLVNPAGWPAGPSNLTVTITHGYDEPPLRIKQAALIYTRSLLVKGPIDERATQLATEDGPINLLTPGQRGSVTGLPEVDAAIDQYADRVLGV